jgi:ribosomal protein S18 acetylase RimI-like enzyme
MAEGSTAAVERIPAPMLGEVRPLLLELLSEDQRHYDRPGQNAAAVDSMVGEVTPGFDGENVVLGIREDERLVAFCWCVFFDPGTGYEAEVADVYVRPEHRGRGLATALVRAAIELFRERDVTFAAVWTHPSNLAAMRLYRSAGFAPTEQTVLTWLPHGR